MGKKNKKIKKKISKIVQQEVEKILSSKPSIGFVQYASYNAVDEQDTY